MHFPSMPPIEAVIFDLDGVLLNSELIYSQATQMILNAFGHTYSIADKLFIMGRSGPEACALLVERFQLPMDPKTYAALFDKAFYNLADSIELTLGARSIIDTLDARALKYGIASSTNQPKFNAKCARHTDFFSRFPVIVMADDPEGPKAKPHPDLFLLAAKRLGVQPAHALVIEDAPLGIVGAKAAGMRTLAFPSPNVPLSEYQHADGIIHHLNDIKNFIN